MQDMWQHEEDFDSGLLDMPQEQWGVLARRGLPARVWERLVTPSTMHRDAAPNGVLI